MALVEDLLKRFPEVKVVGIESPAYDAGPFGPIHYGLMQFSMASVFLARRDCVLFDPATREFLVREDPKAKKGRIHKSDVQRYVQLDTMDVKVIDNNEADAYVLAKFAARLWQLRAGEISPSDLTPSEMQKFVAMKRRVKTLGGTRVKRTAHAFRENARFFEFSRVPSGSVSLPLKGGIRPAIVKYLEDLESAEEQK